MTTEQTNLTEAEVVTDKTELTPDEIRAAYVAQGDTYEIEPFPTDALREVATPITEFGEHWKTVGEKMLRTMYKHAGVGLAANQVGITERIIVMDCTEDASKRYIMLNPEILEKDGVHVGQEGCLSVPGFYADVERASHIKFKYQDHLGNEFVEEADGLLAVCIQHEIDHLNGIMFFDHLSTFEKNKILDKLRKQKKAMMKHKKR